MCWRVDPPEGRSALWGVPEPASLWDVLYSGQLTEERLKKKAGDCPGSLRIRTSSSAGGAEAVPWELWWFRRADPLGAKTREIEKMSEAGQWSIRPLHERDLDDYASIAGESLLGTSRPGWDPYFNRVGRENMYGIFSRDTLAGGLGCYRMGQWFGGRCLSAAGISGVAISPAVRGQGAARHLLETLLQQLRSEGVALATLFASTQRLYRSVGFEQSGTRLQYQLPLRAIPTDAAELEVHRHPAQTWNDWRMSPASGRGVVRAIFSEAGGFGSGCWNRMTRAVLRIFSGGPKAPEGYLILRRSGRAVKLPTPLDVIDMAANTPLAAQSAVGFPGRSLFAA